MEGVVRDVEAGRISTAQATLVVLPQLLTGLCLATLGICAGFAGLASFSGLSDLLAGTPLAITKASAGALTIGGGLFALWHLLLRNVTTFERAVHIAWGIAAGVLLLLITWAASAWFMTSSISGAAALRANMLQHLNEVRKVVAEVGDQAMREAAFASDVLGAAAAYRADADRECQFGGGSRRPGCGPTATAKRHVAEAYQRLGEAIAGYRTTASEDLQDVQRVLMRAAAAANGGGDQREKQAQFAGLIGEVETRLLKVVQASPLPRTGFSGMIGTGDTGSIVPLPFTAQLDQAAQRLMQQRQEVRLPLYMPVNASEAVLQQPAAAAFGWVVSLAIDALPFLMMLFLLLVAWSRRAEHAV